MSETVRETQHEGQEGAGTDSPARILSQGTTQAQRDELFYCPHCDRDGVSIPHDCVEPWKGAGR
jgi:hypothetical protein